jgi:homopolymeric O-antigen transport system permease protein
MSSFSSRLDKLNVLPSQHFIDLLITLCGRELDLRYERSKLGLLWSLLNPLAQIVVYTIVFQYFFRVQIDHYPLFIFVGVLTWNWFREGLLLTTSCITSNSDLLQQPGFPVAVLPLVTIVVSLSDFLAALPILCIYLFFAEIPVTLSWLFLPLILVIQFVLMLGVGYVLASLNTLFRDTQHLLTVALNLMFFMTPIFYDADIVPEAYRKLYDLNPMVSLVDAYRTVIIDGAVPNFSSLLYVVFVAAVISGLGFLIFTRTRYRFYEEL